MLAVRSAHPPDQWVLGIVSLRVKCVGHTTTEFKKEWSYTFPPPICVQGVHRDILTIFTFVIWLASCSNSSVVPGNALHRLCVVCAADKAATHLHLAAGQGCVKIYLYFEARFEMCGAVLCSSVHLHDVLN
jgi:hypothetical protein